MSDPKESYSEVANFYRGRSVFITGATGFIGKVLVEKLLRSCPGVGNIYVLMRPKRGNDVETRLMELTNTRVFDWVKREQPETLNKVIALQGDITAPKLGLSPADYNLVTENVSVVFHSAATVKFDEPLADAVAMNMIGTKSVVELCRNMENLEAVIHVSTAYCNCDRKEINEVLYPPPDDPEKILKCVECLDKDVMDKVTPYLIKSRPNTYTFTKALAEHIFVKESAGLPAAIVRPSIVVASWKEPLPGWIDNLNGPTGFLTGAGKGVLRTLLCYRDLVADFIPVDIAINLLITVAWHTSKTRPNVTPIYNCTSGGVHPIRWRDLEHMCYISIITKPFNDILWYPGGSFKSSKLINALCTTLMQTIPAHIVDIGSRLTGKKPVMVKIQKKFQKALTAIEFFTTHEWKFTSSNVINLFSKLSEQDKKIFYFDVRQVDWKSYVMNYVEGIKLYILKEDPKSSQAAMIRMRKMYYVHMLTQILILALFTKFLLVKTNTGRKLWYSLWTASLYLGRAVMAPIAR